MAKESVKIKKTGIFDYVLLTICLCVLALRATNTEAINISAATPWINLADDLTSLIFTSVLFGCIVLWFINRLVRKTFVYSLTALELPALVFVIAGLVSLAIASNKRSAINDFVTMIVPVLAAIMLVQILDSHAKIRLVLAVIVALACASAYRCAGQYFTDVQMMIDQYKADPQSLLAPLGIKAGSFEAWLFEHRLYTKGINGFLTTGNSVASFSIFAAFAALALFLEHLKAAAKNKRSFLPAVMIAAALIAVLLNFVFVRSKGGTAAFLFALILFAALLFFGAFVTNHRKKILVVVLLCVIAGAAVVIDYGLKHGRLPGGNSMLVRWQYWTAAAQMYTDHPISGVGPGNFSSYYPHYKAPAALETVKDPHNFLLSILTQYGPLGLTAFLALLLVPLWQVLAPPNQPRLYTPDSFALSRRTVVTFAVFISAALLVIRPILNPLSLKGEPPIVIAYVLFTLYVTPVIVFALAFLLAWAFAHRYPFNLTSITLKALFCACIGVCIHNLIDFAIFEPGIYTTLWVALACLIALHRLRKNLQPSVYTISPPIRLVLLVLLAVPVWALCHYALLPVAATTFSVYQARNAYNASMLDQTQQLLKTAAQKDRFNPHPSLTSAALYLQYLDYYGPNQKDVLALAEKSLLTAAARDPADFKPYEKLTALYMQLADKSTGRDKDQWLHKSFDAASRAVQLYPALDHLRFALAQAAEAAGRPDIALANYRKAVEIEDAYRAQFKTMYPDRRLFSRLGNEKYDQAKKRIAQLQP